MKKKFLSATMAMVTLFTATACVGKNVDDGIGNKGEGLEISILNYDGGIGSEWLEASAARFAEIKKRPL